jgi:hypothetical protein
MNQSNLQFVTAIFICALASGCSVQKDFVPVDGSKADATILVGFKYDVSSEKPVYDVEQAYAVAKDRCMKWGFSDAEFWEPEQWAKCSDSTWQGCDMSDRVVLRRYQCLD